MLTELCLSFSIITGSNNLHIPLQAQELSYSRIKKQFDQDKAPLILKFEDKSCPYQGEYWYGVESITLSADHKYWQGRLELPLTDLIDGIKINFSTVVPDLNNNTHKQADKFELAFFDKSHMEKQKKEKKIWPWIVAGALGVGSAYAGVKLYQLSQKKNQPKETRSLPPPRKGSSPKRFNSLFFIFGF